MFSLNCKGRLLTATSPIVMGILNATPDSFYSGSRHASIDDGLRKAEHMLSEGAAILDIGGQSTRPGAALVNAAEESQRIVPLVEAIRSHFPGCFISVDTYYSSVVRDASDAGADIANDISGGSFDADMLSTVAQLHMPYVCMHLKGSPQTMHDHSHYDDITSEVIDYFTRKIEACTHAGIHDVIVDPGFGFSKNSAHNFEMLRHFEAFNILQKPLLLGISRKSTIYKTLGITAEEALNGTTVLHTAGLLKGAGILRVHDVKEAVEAVKLTAYLR